MKEYKRPQKGFLCLITRQISTTTCHKLLNIARDIHTANLALPRHCFLLYATEILLRPPDLARLAEASFVSLHIDIGSSSHCILFRTLSFLGCRLFRTILGVFIDYNGITVLLDRPLLAGTVGWCHALHEFIKGS